jgi:hypothetical protein
LQLMPRSLKSTNENDDTYAGCSQRRRWWWRWRRWRWHSMTQWLLVRVVTKFQRRSPVSDTSSFQTVSWRS